MATIVSLHSINQTQIYVAIIIYCLSLLLQVVIFGSLPPLYTGTNEVDTRAVQVDEKACNLNSNDCFVLETPKCTYVWYGKVCSLNTGCGQ